MRKSNIIALFITIVMLISTVPAFAAGEVTLSGTISLPGGITAKSGDYIKAELYPMKRNEKNKITIYYNYNIYSSDEITLQNGQASAFYSVTAPKGSYALCVNASVDGVHTQQQFYTSDGTVEHIELAEPIDLSANKTADMTLTPFERSVSGTITLSKPAEQDGYISLALCGTDGSGSFYSTIPVAKGQTTANYNIYADKRIYYLAVSGRPPFATDYYYSVKGNFLYNRSDRCYIDTREKSVSLDFDLPTNSFVIYGKPAISSGGSASGTVGDEDWIDVTVKLPDGITADKFIKFYAKDADDENSVNWFASADIPKTSTLVTADGVPQENDYYIVVNADWRGFHDDTEYYYSKSAGLTSDIGEATVFKGSQKSITIDLSDAFSVISGTVSRNGAKIGEALDFNIYAYVPAEDDDPQEDIYNGKIFFVYNTYIKENENSTNYSILIPRELSGNVMLTMDYYSNETIENQHEYVTIPGSVTKNLIFPNIFHKITGTITLTSPAPKGGAAVSVSQFKNNTVYYYVPQGERTVDYEYYALNDSKELVLETICDDKRFERYAFAEINNETTKSDSEIVMYAQNISGTVSMKNGTSMPNAVSYKVTAIAYDENDEVIDSMEQYGTIFPDGAAGTYSINLPDNIHAAEILFDILAEGDMELTVIPEDNGRDFVLTPDVGVTAITAVYNTDDDNISIDYTSDGKADYTAWAIVAVYDDNDALAAVHSEEITFDKDSSSLVFPAEIGDEITENSTVRLFIWRSPGSLKPVTDSEITLNMTSNQGGE